MSRAASRSRSPYKTLQASRASAAEHDEEDEEGEEEDVTGSEEKDGEDVLATGDTHAWHFDMLHDSARLAAFCDAFERLPAAALRGRALDVGCGSGVLGMALLQRQPALRRVDALEVEPALFDVAARNARRSGLVQKGRLSVHCVKSSELASLDDLLPAGAARGKTPERASLLVAEILDAGLLGEDCLGTLRHAASKLLTKDYFAVPASADVYACAVESTVLARWQIVDPDAWWAPREYKCDDGDANPHDVCLQRLVEAGEAKVLTPEFHAMKFDFEDLPPEGGRSRTIEVQASATGRVDAIVFWWYCQMVRDDKHPSMTNAPTWATAAGSLPKKNTEIDHWRQAVCVLPRSARVVQAGETLRVAVAHNDEDIWFRLLDGNGANIHSTVLPRATTSLAAWSESRLWMLADKGRNSLLRRAAFAAVEDFVWRPWQRHAGILVLDLSDGPIMGLLVYRSLHRLMRRWTRQRSNSRRMLRLLSISGCRPTVMNLESTEEDLKLTTEIIDHVLSSAPRRSCGFNPMIKTVLGSPSLSPQSVTMICAEPYTRSCEGLPCDTQMWQHWSQVDSLRWALSPSVVLLPWRFRIKAALISCPELWKRRQPISEAVCGVDVSAINALHPEAAAETTFRERFPCALWQMAHTIVGGTVTICEVAFSEEFPEKPRDFPETCFSFPASNVPICGLATWTEVDLAASMPCFSTADFRLDNESKQRRFAPVPWRQGILLAQQPRAIGRPRATLCVKARFIPKTGSFVLQARWADSGQLF